MNRLFTSTALALAMTASAAWAQTSTQQPSQQRPTMSQSGAGGMTQQQPGQMMADDLIGSDVRNAQGEDIGDVVDLVISPDGRVAAAILSVGGFLGVGDKHVAVPWNQIQASGDASRAGASSAPGGTAPGAAAPVLVVTVNMTKDQLKQAPEFKSASDQRRSGSGTSPSGAPADPSRPGGTTAPSR